jgi:restriction endonuclease
MELQFKNQDFQEAATVAVCDVFEGQPYHDPNVYTVDPGRKNFTSNEQFLFEDEPEVGYKNSEIKLPIDVRRKI